MRYVPLLSLLASLACATIPFDCDVDNDLWFSHEAANRPECQGELYIRYTDCDDEDYLAYPGAWEICDGTDNDCDGRADEDRACW